MTQRSEEQSSERLFSVEQANAALPLVSAISQDLSALSQDLADRRHRLELLTSGRDAKSGDPYSDELEHIQEELKKDDERLQGYRREMEELGVTPRSGPRDAMDVVDFPAKLDGREVFLCWQLGEQEVSHWHARGAEFEDRQSLEASVAGRDG